MRQGVRLGVDAGRTRVGVAVCDREGLIATPVRTLDRAAAEQGMAALLAEYEPVEVVVGLPLSLSGAETASTADARALAQAIARLSAVPVRLVDERMSTVSAQRSLHATGRTVKRSRAVIDQAAAVVILQHALDAERSAGSPPGALVPSPATEAP